MGFRLFHFFRLSQIWVLFIFLFLYKHYKGIIHNSKDLVIMLNNITKMYDSSQAYLQFVLSMKCQRNL